MLRLNGVSSEVDEDFLNQFLVEDGNLTIPAESLLIDTKTLEKLSWDISSNKTYCFNTQPGEFGWCATCKVIQWFL